MEVFTIHWSLTIHVLITFVGTVLRSLTIHTNNADRDGSLFINLYLLMMLVEAVPETTLCRYVNSLNCLLF